MLVVGWSRVDRTSRAPSTACHNRGVELFWAGLALGAASGAAPGPLLALAVTMTLRRGIGAGMQVAIAPLLTDVIIIGLSLTVITQVPSSFLPWFTLVGAGVVAWFAVETFRGAASGLHEISSERPAWVAGALMNITNPAPWLFWITVGAPLIRETAQVSWAPAGAFLLAFYLSIVGVKALLVFGLGAARHRISLRTYQLIVIGAGVLLVVVAIGLAYSALTSLLA